MIQILLSLLQVLANSARDCHSPGHRGMVIIALLSAAGLVAPLCPSGIGRRPFKYDLYSIFDSRNAFRVTVRKT